MDAIFSVIGEGVCYGRATSLKLAKKIESYYKSMGLQVEIETSFVYSRVYEVDEMLCRLKECLTPKIK